TKENLQWKQIEKNVEINLPEYNPNTIMSPHAFAVKIENFGRFASKPVIELDYSKDAMKPTVTIHTDIGTLIYYTTDGTAPSESSKIYNGPFTAEKTFTLKALAIMGGSGENYASLIPSAIVTAEIKTYEWKNPLKVSDTKPGIAFRYFEPTGKIDLSSINNNPTVSGVATIISHQNKKRADKFAFEFTGYIKIEKDAMYTFFTDSDDGSMLYIDDEEIVNNDGDHGNVEKSGKAALKKGFHKIKVVYFDSGGGNSLRVSLQPESGKKEVIPAALLFH
ncbi:MAG TPA: PA14 domain-containing protein, partial [Chitinophagaceae bacterium]|nr:PA14 domain-containing protein [Chitinophagaceae bacterium]